MLLWSIFDRGFARFMYIFLFFEVTVGSEAITTAFVDNLAASVNIPKAHSHLKKQN